jgi:uncharacterized surface protein with fasciclin (FAS1) repeats
MNYHQLKDKNMNHRLIGFWGMALGIVLLWTSCKKPDYGAIPVSTGVNTLGNYLDNNFSFTLFDAAVRKAGLMDSLLNTNAAYTIMAPIDAALNKDSIFFPSDFDRWPPDSLKYYVRSHILWGKIFYSDIPTASDNLYANLNGVNLYLSKTNNGNSLYFYFIVDGVPVQQAPSLSASTPVTYGTTLLNGVIYPVISSIKAGSGTVQGFLSSRPDLSHLVAGLKKFGLWDNLGGNGPYTVVAPVDSAFERYGMTTDSIARLDTSMYSPILFGGYFAAPNHVYVLDLAQLNNLSMPNQPFSTISPQYKLLLGVGGNALSIMSAGLAKAPVTAAVPNLIGPGSTAVFGSRGVPFLGESAANQLSYMTATNPPAGTYVNYSFSNGVVHLLSGVLVQPSDVPR